MKKYRAAVIGHTGRGDYGHGLDTVYVDMPDVDVCAVADADPQGLKEAGERLGVPQGARYADYRAMLEAEKPDLVSVCPRWVGERRAMVLAAVEAGVKGIYCEKPLAPSPADADAIVGACEKSGVKLAVAHQSRFNPLIDRLRQALADELIGEVRDVYGTPKQDPRGGGEDLVVLGTHILDLMCFLFGNPSWVQAFIRQGGVDVDARHVHPGNEEIGLIAGDHLQATFGFDDGVVGYLASKKGPRENGKRSPGLIICGSEGLLAYRGGYVMHYPNPCWTPVPDADEWQVLAGPVKVAGKALNHLLVQDLIDAVERDREPVASGRAARWALEMIFGAFASHRAGQRLPLPLERRSHPFDGWSAEDT